MAVDLNRLKVLVVDDNAYMLTIMRSLLNGFGVKSIFESRDPTDAFDMVRSDTLDIIITDYQMDILDGLDLVRLIRTADDSPNPMVPIIMLTAFSERNRVKMARDAGVTEFCAKPITPRDMFAKLTSIINAPRPFIRNKTFFGPDRRRAGAGQRPYSGPERRAGAKAEPTDEDEAGKDGVDAA